MKRYIYFVVLAMVFVACSNERKKRPLPNGHMAENGADTLNKVPLTAFETEGLKDITNFYGGECVHSAGKTVTSGKKYFEVQVSKSMSIENTKDMIGLSAANIACIFYQNLQADSNKYDEIHVRIIMNDGKKLAQDYPVSSLAVVVSKMKTVMMVVGAIKDKNYTGLAGLINSKNKVSTFDKEKLLDDIKKADASLGNVEQFVPYGYAFYKADNGVTVLRISGAMKRDKQNNEFSVVIDPESTKDEVIMINYKL